MIHNNPLKLVAPCVALLIAAPTTVPAQDPSEDWDFGADPARKLTIAAMTFENFGVAVRCLDDNLSVVVSGLPVASGERRLRYIMGDQPDRESVWVSGRDSNAAFAVWPRSVAAGMSRGGRLVIVAPDGEQTRRYAVDLPASSASIGRVFQACGKTLETETQTAAPSGESFAGLRWAEGPQINFPNQARYDVGIAAISCKVRANGRMRDCEIESEFPEGSGFGRASQYAANRTARVEPLDSGGPSMEDRRIAFVTRFFASNGGYLPPAPSRLPGEDELNNPAGQTRTPPR